MSDLFTIGFTKSSAEDFFGRLRRAGVKKVIDTRLKNSSQLAGFAKAGDLPFFLRAIGDIAYANGDTGILVYLKAAMTGHEDTSVRQYKSSHPEFPHESTGDQFYGEDQFESYRHLGRDIGHEVFAPVAGETSLLTAGLKLQQLHKAAVPAVVPAPV